MCEMTRSDRALSETLSVVFMAMLVIIAALLLIASMTGVISNLLQKPALLSAQVLQYDTSDGHHIIGVFHQQGDAVDLNGTTQTGGTSIVSLTLIDPGGNSHTVSPDGSPLHTNQWEPGDMLYIYKSGSSYVYTDVAPPSEPDLAQGTYMIKIIDNKVNVIINALPVTIQ
jgi:hypothetical protein